MRPCAPGAAKEEEEKEISRGAAEEKEGEPAAREALQLRTPKLLKRDRPRRRRRGNWKGTLATRKT